MSPSKNRFTLIPAVYLVLRRNDEILLLQRANTGYQDGKYSLIAGHMDGDELATAAIIREAKEEAGIDILVDDLRFVHVAHRLTRGEVGQERLDLFFETSVWQGEIVNQEPHKCQELAWYPVDDLPNATIPFIKEVLRNIKDGVSYSEYTTEPL